MEFETFSFILLIVVFGEGALKPLCSAEEPIIKFSIISKRNATWHRLFEVDLHKYIPLSSNASDEITLDVTFGRSVYGTSEVMTLATTIVALDDRSIVRRTDYELFQGLGYYKMHTSGQQWDSARLTCIAEGGDLIVINSDAEANVVKEFFKRNLKISDSDSTGYIFAGFHDKNTEGEFVTVKGKSLSQAGYAKWDSGEPGGGIGQNYGGVSSSGLLRDISNAWKLPFICEQEM